MRPALFALLVLALMVFVPSFGYATPSEFGGYGQPPVPDPNPVAGAQAPQAAMMSSSASAMMSSPSAGVSASTSNTGSIQANISATGLNMDELRRANSQLASQVAGQSAAQSRVAARVAVSQLLAAATKTQRSVTAVANVADNPVKATIDAINDKR